MQNSLSIKTLVPFELCSQNFKIEAALGGGAFGTVYKVKALQSSRMHSEGELKGKRVMLPTSQKEQ